MKICLDPGHGGADNGASGNKILEDAWALQFAERLGHYLRALGAEVIFTRTTDKRVGLTTRAAIAVNARCDVFLSIHANSSANHTADGVEAFYAPSGPYQNNSMSLLGCIVKECSAAGLDNRGVKWDSLSQHTRLTVLRETCKHMPAGLLEVGFVSNAHDAGLMKNARWVEDLAAKLASVVVK